MEESPNMPQSAGFRIRFRAMDKVALGFFVAALLSFVAAHFFPLFSYMDYDAMDPFVNDPEIVMKDFMGWQIWPLGLDLLESFQSSDISSLLFVGGLLMAAATFLTSPFLLRSVALNRLLWWLLFVASVLSITGLTGVLMWWLIREPLSEDEVIGLGLPLLMAAPLLHLCGVLSIRKYCAPSDPLAVE